MNPITNLTSLSVNKVEDFNSAPSKPLKTDGLITSNVQSKKGFWRRIKHSKSSLVFESSSGGSIQINVSDLWKLAENKDGKLAIPK